MKTKKWVCSGIIAALAVTVALSMFLPFFDRDFSGFGKDLVNYEWKVNKSNTLMSVSNGVGLEADFLIKKINRALTGNGSYSVSFSGFEITQKIPDLKNDMNDYSEVKGSIVSAMSMVLLPLAFSLFVFVFSWFRKKWSYMTTLVLSAFGIAALLIITLWLFPANIYNDIMHADLEDVSNHVGKTLKDSSWNEDLAELTGGGVELEKEGKVLHIEEKLEMNKTAGCSYVWSGLGPAFFICAIGLALMLAASITGIILSQKSELTSVEMGLICYFGPLAGEKIPVYEGEFVTMGSDNTCDLVIKELSSMHCAVTWSEKSGNYIIVNPENAKIILENGRELKPGGSIQLKSGESMFLGNKACRVTLS